MQHAGIYFSTNLSSFIIAYAQICKIRGLCHVTVRAPNKFRIYKLHTDEELLFILYILREILRDFNSILNH